MGNITSKFSERTLQSDVRSLLVAAIGKTNP
jgi:hypothetical protein